MKTLREWKARLQPKYAEALDECVRNDNMPLSPREALDIIVRYHGGIASGYEIVCLVNELWGGQLPAEPSWS